MMVRGVPIVPGSMRVQRRMRIKTRLGVWCKVLCAETLTGAENHWWGTKENSMKDYSIDHCSLVIKDYEDLMNPRSLKSITTFFLPGKGLDVDEIPEQIFDEFRTGWPDGIGGYEITDTRSIMRWGASGATQEIVFAIVSGAAEGAIAPIIKRLWGWCESRFGRKEWGSLPKVRYSMEAANGLILEHFNPQGALSTLEISMSDAGSRFVLEDAAKNRYVVETAGGHGRRITARKLSDVHEY
jgi:hypothetical protein